MLRLIPSPRKAHASLTWVTYEVSHSPHLEQWDFAGNLSGHELGSMGRGPRGILEVVVVEDDDTESKVVVVAAVLCNGDNDGNGDG